MKKKIKKVLIMLVCFLVWMSIATIAAEDPFDLSQYQKDMEGIGNYTKVEVQRMADEAVQLYEDGDYEIAEEALKEWARASNVLANIISAGLEPFYDASYDDRKEFPYSKLKVFIPYESLANKLKEDRNHAMVMRAEILVKLDRKKEAIALYQKALDLIDINDWAWWIRAVNGLYEIIDIELIKTEENE